MDLKTLLHRAMIIMEILIRRLIASGRCMMICYTILYIVIPRLGLWLKCPKLSPKLKTISLTLRGEKYVGHLGHIWHQGFGIWVENRAISCLQADSRVIVCISAIGLDATMLRRRGITCYLEGCLRISSNLAFGERSTMGTGPRSIWIVPFALPNRLGIYIPRSVWGGISGSMMTGSRWFGHTFARMAMCPERGLIGHCTLERALWVATLHIRTVKIPGIKNSPLILWSIVFLNYCMMIVLWIYHAIGVVYVPVRTNYLLVNENVCYLGLIFDLILHLLFSEFPFPLHIVMTFWLPMCNNLVQPL